MFILQILTGAKVCRKWLQCVSILHFWCRSWTDSLIHDLGIYVAIPLSTPVLKSAACMYETGMQNCERCLAELQVVTQLFLGIARFCDVTPCSLVTVVQAADICGTTRAHVHVMFELLAAVADQSNSSHLVMMPFLVGRHQMFRETCRLHHHGSLLLWRMKCWYVFNKQHDITSLKTIIQIQSVPEPQTSTAQYAVSWQAYNNLTTQLLTSHYTAYMALPKVSQAYLCYSLFGQFLYVTTHENIQVLSRTATVLLPLMPCGHQDIFYQKCWCCLWNTTSQLFTANRDFPWQ